MTQVQAQIEGNVKMGENQHFREKVWIKVMHISQNFRIWSCRIDSKDYKVNNKIDKLQQSLELKLMPFYLQMFWYMGKVVH
jgi:hypothetical protein